MNPPARPSRLVPMAAALLGLASLVPPAEARQAREATRPNIVLIVADDLGWNDVGFHGSEIATPNLDRLATSGVRLDGHYVFPVCSPTRTALLTGRNPSRFGILSAIGEPSTLSVPADTVSLADVLKARGYTTAIAGKWHLGLRPEVGPRQLGFDWSYGYLHGQIDPYTHLYKNGDRTWNRDDRFLDEAGHATDLIAAEAVRRIEAGRAGGSPFFLYLAFSVPHTPLAEDARWTSQYEGKIPEPSRRLFAAAVTHMDDAIGRVVAALDRAGLRGKTLIVFTSDNGGQKDQSYGDQYGGRYAPNKVLGDNKPLRGWKGELYEGGIRVPALANWPGTLAPRVVTAPISALDWLPTIAKLVGAPADATLRWEGTDVWPLLSGEATAGPARTLYWKTPQAWAVREGDWKLIVPGGKRKGEPQLFNLADDPYETTDQAPRQPERVARLRELLRQQQALDP
jgi:arylsulfatase A-like enzyme